MARVDKRIEVSVPVSTAYNQWTQFEEFPRFMEGVQYVHQIEGERLFWVAEVAGELKEWYARITRQVPDKVIAWESEGGTVNSGTVIFKPLADDKAEVELHIEYDPEDFKEKAGGALGFVSRRVDADLNRFKQFIEERGMETGAWRGEIIHGKYRPVAPLQDSVNQPDDDQLRRGISGLDVRSIEKPGWPADDPTQSNRRR
jgi:uncharacterized membrane protein